MVKTEPVLKEKKVDSGLSPKKYQPKDVHRLAKTVGVYSIVEMGEEGGSIGTLTIRSLCPANFKKATGRSSCSLGIDEETGCHTFLTMRFAAHMKAHVDPSLVFVRPRAMDETLGCGVGMGYIDVAFDEEEEEELHEEL